MVLAIVFAICLLVLNSVLLTQGWMQIKLVFVGGPTGYHFYCHAIYKNLHNGNFKYRNNFMRLFNEGPTLVLFSVIFLVMLRNSIDRILGVIGLFALAILLMLGLSGTNVCVINSRW